MTKLMIVLEVDDGLDPDDVSGLDEETYSALLQALMRFGYDIDIQVTD